MFNDYRPYDYPMSLFSPDDFKDMVDDWLFEHDEEEADLIIDGEPYYDDSNPYCDYGCWQQDAHDDKCSYSLVATSEGNIEIHYGGTF